MTVRADCACSLPLTPTHLKKLLPTDCQLSGAVEVGLWTEAPCPHPQVAGLWKKANISPNLPLYWASLVVQLVKNPPAMGVKVKVLSRVRHFATLRTDYSLPGSSVHGIFQARILEWVAISFSRRSSQPMDWTQVYPHCRQTPYRLSHLGSGLQRVRHDRLLLALYWLLSGKQLDPFCFKMMFILQNFYVVGFLFFFYCTRS